MVFFLRLLGGRGHRHGEVAIVPVTQSLSFACDNSLLTVLFSPSLLATALHVGHICLAVIALVPLMLHPLPFYPHAKELH